MHPPFAGLFWLALFLTCSLTAQSTGPVEFGRISDADRALNVFPADSSAEAYVLYDHLDLDFEYSDVQGPSTIEKIHRRVKLFKPSAYERANVKLEFDREYVEISDVEGFVHLAEGGSIPLTSAEINTQDGEGLRKIISFTFPRLSPGVTIEYRYVKRTKSILTPTVYTFQEDIPVRWAEYTALIPAYYDYVSLGASGRYTVNEAEIVKRQWGPNFSSGAYSSNNKLDHTRIRWAMQDIAAYDYQPYTNNFVDYLPKARLQLRGVQYPGRPKNSVFSSWEETVKDLQDRQDFGRYYRNKINYSKLWRDAEPVVIATDDTRARIEAAYRFVIGHYAWNGRYRILASASPNSTYSDGSGNSADLNIALLSLLNEAGIEAYPLLVSLRDQGSPIESYPMLDQFDHLMVYTEVDGKPLLLDANDPDRPAGLPRFDALNHRGWVADEKNPRWVDLTVAPAHQTAMAVLDVDGSGRATAEVTARMDSYFAFSTRSKLRGMEKNQDGPLVADIVKQFPEATVLEGVTATDDDPTKDQIALTLKMDVPAGQALDDYLYVQPVLLSMLDDELDDVDQRLYPIDFAYPWVQRYIAQINLPEGYVVDEVPASIRLRSDDGTLVATYATQENAALRTLSINFTVQLDRTLFAAEEYGPLREMFHRIIELQRAPVVLKRAK
ncbi:DUF3857 domain-containing protein [Neolewinella sp.]|uniref:DUF3857 domain-containing protein n=1 Tax=Neolewinella sp. TaxID=2993543 RepID=UPI003B51ECF2